MPPKKRRSSYVDDEAHDSGGDSDDVALSRLQLNDPEEQALRQLDDDFIHDEEEELPSPSPRNAPSSGDEEVREPPRVTRSRRLTRNNSAQSPEALMHHHRKHIDFGSSDSEDEDRSKSESYSKSPQQKKKMRGKGKKKRHVHQTVSSKSKSISQVRKKKKAPALYKMIGKALLEEAHECGHVWEEGRFGFYDSWSDGDLPVVEFHRACDWFSEHFNFHSLGRERGEDMGRLHSQGHGGAYAPYTKAGCAALSQKYKEDMNILTHSRRKIQFKLLDVKDQTEDKMCAYTRKFRAFQEFLFHSSDRNGEAYTTEYLDMCDDRYRVMRA